MKKTFILSILLLILVSCGKIEEISNNKISNDGLICKSSFEVGKIDKSKINLKGVVISDDLKTISSPMAGIVSSLNCDAGKKVNSNSLIAKIVPDFNNPNIINLSIQKGSLINQRNNLESIKNSTILNFDNQISDIKEQIDISKKNIELTKRSSNLNKNDLEKQIDGLEDTLSNLKSNLKLAQKGKIESLEKIDISRESFFTNINSISGDNILKIDETFGITDDNKDLNDKYEDYLSAKKSSLRNDVKNEFIRLNMVFKNINNLSDNEISVFLGDLISLNQLTKDAVKESIVNVNFTQIQIDSLYLMFLTYSNSLAEIKSGWDSLENSKSSISTSYDTQILSLQNQIDSTNTNLENLKTNKLDGIDVGLDLQLSNFDSGLKTLNTNLLNLISSKDSQVLSLDNQILQIDQSIDSLNTNLSSRNIYANVSGIIKQKTTSKGNNVGSNTSICQILPDAKSTKIKIYSPIELKMGDKLVFTFNDELYEIRVENVLVYKDPVTQNYIYESNYLDQNYFKDGEILNLSFYDNNENKILIDEKKDENNIKKVKVPVGYVVNKINGNFIKIKTGSGIIINEVKLGDINGDLVEIINGLEGVVEICK